jgi:hypothetical protein
MTRNLIAALVAAVIGLGFATQANAGDWRHRHHGHKYHHGWDKRHHGWEKGHHRGWRDRNHDGRADWRDRRAYRYRTHHDRHRDWWRW